MRGLSTAVFLIVVNVCAALENIEFMIGGRKITVPLGRPIHVPRATGVNWADFKFSLPKFIELLPFVGEEAYQTHAAEHVPDTHLPGDAFPSRFETKHQYPDDRPNHRTQNPSVSNPVPGPDAMHDHLRDSIQSPQIMTGFPNLDESYDALLLNSTEIEAQSSYTTSAEEVEPDSSPKLQLVQEKKLHEPVAIPFPSSPYLPEKLPTISETILQPVIDSIPPVRSTETVTEIDKAPPILTKIHESFITPLPLTRSPAVIVESEKFRSISSLEAKLYLPQNKTREIPIILHSFKTPPIRKVTLPPTVTLRSFTTPKLHSPVTSPSIASLPLFPKGRLQTSVVTPLPNTTLMLMTTAQPEMALVSDTTSVGVTPAELNMNTNTVTTLPPVTSPEPDTTIASDTILVTATLREQDMTLKLETMPVSVISSETASRTTPGSDTTRMPVILLEPDTTLVSITKPVPSPVTDPTLMLGRTAVTVTSPKPDSIPMSVLVTTSMPSVVTNIASPVSKTPLVTSKSVMTSKSRVISPLIANIPLFSEWRLHNSVVLDATPVSDTTPVSGTIMESDYTLELYTTPGLLISTEALTTPVLDTTSVPVTSLEPETISVSGIALVPVTSPVAYKTQMLDTTSVPLKSPEPDLKPVSVLITTSTASVVTDFTSPVSTTSLVTSKSVSTSKPRVISPLIENIPLFPGWRLHKPVVTPVTDTAPVPVTLPVAEKILVSDTTSVSMMSLETDPKSVLDRIPVPVTSLELETITVLSTSPEVDKTLMLDTTPGSVISVEPDFKLVADTTLVTMTSPESDLIPVLDRTPVLVTSPEPDPIPVSVLVTTSISSVVTDIAHQVSTTPLVTSEYITTSKPHVMSPLIANIPLFPAWRLNKSVMPDASPVTGSATVLETFTESVRTPELETMSVISLEPETTSVPGSTPVPVTSPEADKTPGPNTMPVTSPTLDSKPVSDTTPVPVTLLEKSVATYTTPGSDITPDSVTSPKSESTLGMFVTNVASVTTSPLVLVSSKSITPYELRPLMTSPLIANIPLFPEWRLHKSEETPLLDMTLVTSSLMSDITTLQTTSPDEESIPVSDITPLLVTSKMDTMERPDKSLELATPNSNVPINKASLADLPLFRDWMPYKSRVPLLDAPPVSDTIVMPENSTEIYNTPGSDILPELLTSTEADTTLVLDTMQVLMTSVEPVMTPVSDITPPVPDTPTERHQISESDAMLGILTSTEAVIPVPVLDTTPLSKTSAECDTIIVSDTTPELLMTTKGESIPKSSTIPESETSTASDQTPGSDTTPELLTFSRTETVLVPETTSMRGKSPKRDPTKVLDTMPEHVTLIEASSMSDTTTMSVALSDTDTTPTVVALLVLDTTSVPMTSLESSTKLVSDTTPMPLSLPALDSTFESDPILEPKIRQVAQSSNPLAIASLPLFPESRLHNLIETTFSNTPFSATSPRQDTTPLLVTPLVQESTTVWNTEPVLMTSSFVATTPLSDTLTPTEKDTTPVPEFMTVPILLPKTSMKKDTVIMPMSLTSKKPDITVESDIIQVPVALPISGISSMEDNDLVPATSHVTDTTAVSDTMPVSVKSAKLVMTSLADTTQVAMISTESDIITISDKISVSGSDTTLVSETATELVTSPEPESLLPVLDTALVPEKTVERLTSSLLFETTVASMTSDLLSDPKIPVRTSLESESTTAPSTTITTTVPSTSFSVTNGARPADTVTSRRPATRTAQVSCMNRKSSKKKGRLGRQCLKNRALRHLAIHIQYKAERARQPPRYTVTLRRRCRKSRSGGRRAPVGSGARTGAGGERRSRPSEPVAPAAATAPRQSAELVPSF